MSRIECPPAEKAFQLSEFNIQSVASVVELEVGAAHGFDQFGTTCAVSAAARQDNLNKTAIIIPTKNEPVDTLMAVFSAIPGGILVIVVSNSSRAPGDDKYKEEVEAVRRHCRLVGNRPAFIIHQKDPGAGEAFEAAGEKTITDGDHKIRNGKGEGMILGLAVVASRYPERRFVGFVDSDNLVPGSVTEYCNVFASGFYMYREQPNIMVRIQWGSKPKSIKGRLDGTREGRSSVIVNKWLNHLLTRCPSGSSANTSGVMVTGNAGEHAMTMDLAVQLPFAGGYAIETYHIVALLSMAIEDSRHGQRANGANGQANGNTHRRGHQSGRISATVAQIKTINPHIHRPGDEDHIRGMFLEGLGAIFHHLPSVPFGHSRATNGYGGGDWQAQFRGEMLAYLEQKGLGRANPPAPRVYKPLGSLDLHKMHTIMTQKCRTLEVMGQNHPGPFRGHDFHA